VVARNNLFFSVLPNLEFLHSILVVEVVCNRKISIVDLKNQQIKVSLQVLWQLETTKTILREKNENLSLKIDITRYKLIVNRKS